MSADTVLLYALVVGFGWKLGCAIEHALVATVLYGMWHAVYGLFKVAYRIAMRLREPK